MSKHTKVVLTNGRYLDGAERQTVIDMAHNGEESTQYKGHKIDLVSHYRKDSEVVITVRVSDER